ncbi:hypothetical protein Btru_014306 [Bulinus truncatus]|nr:hypothetical protein Btru_014306 [Bulinus truncatus]
MGNDTSKRDSSSFGSEMLTARDIYGDEVQRTDDLEHLAQMREESLRLTLGLARMVEALEDVMSDPDVEMDEGKTEARLLAMAKHNQAIIRGLARDLEDRAKVFSLEVNEKLMVVVKEVVSAVNGYMNTLLMIIKKLKRVATSAAQHRKCLDGLQRTRYGVIHSPPKPPARASDVEFDIICEHQDVDAMLLQLVESERDRQELERGVIMMLVYGRLNLKEAIHNKNYLYLNMAASRYRSLVQLMQQWPVDKLKGDRDLSILIKKQVLSKFPLGEASSVDTNECDKMYNSLLRISLDVHRKKWERQTMTNCTGLNEDELRCVLYEDSNYKSYIDRIKEKIFPKK